MLHSMLLYNFTDAPQNPAVSIIRIDEWGSSFLWNVGTLIRVHM